MKFVLRFHAEITVKSKSLRQRYSKLLSGNVRNLLKKITEQVHVRGGWDKIEVEVQASEQELEAVRRALVCIPGIAHIDEVLEVEFVDFEQAFQFVLAHKQADLEHQRFAVKVRRTGQHDFTSTDLAAYIGGGIKARVEGTQVNLSHPDVIVQLWLEHSTLRLQTKRLQGLGGFPLPSQETVVSLISGGFDSAVASYELIRRGARTHYCFFNLGAAEAHEAAVREITYFIWNKYSSTHPVKFVSVDFSQVVEAILTQPDQGIMGVLLKRAMLKAASQVAEQLHAQALVTGEALGQVSSQTLSNLQIIDQVVPKLVLRPLITMDKQDIVDQARVIGVADMAAAIPEYCGVISNKPTVNAPLDRIQTAEQVVTDALIEEAVAQATFDTVADINQKPSLYLPQICHTLDANLTPVVLDIRSAEEEEQHPLQVSEGIEVVHIPFFMLARKYKELDPKVTYALYCNQGVMSRLQAIALKQKGFEHLLIYEPSEQTKQTEGL